MNEKLDNEDRERQLTGKIRALEKEVNDLKIENRTERDDLSTQLMVATDAVELLRAELAVERSAAKKAKEVLKEVGIKVLHSLRYSRRGFIHGKSFSG